MGWKRERFHFRIQQIAPHFLAAERNALTPDDQKTMYNFVVLSQPSKTQVMLLTDDCYWPADRIDSARRQRACQHGGSLTKEKKKTPQWPPHLLQQATFHPATFFFFFFLCTQNTLAQLRRDTKHVLCVKGHAVHISSVSTVYSGEQIKKKKDKSSTGAFVLLISLSAS